MKRYLSLLPTALIALATIVAVASPTSAALAQVEEPREPNWRQIEGWARQLQSTVYWARVYAEREGRNEGFRGIGIRDLRDLEMVTNRFEQSARSPYRDAARLSVELDNVERSVWRAEGTVTRREFSYEVVMRVDEARRLVSDIDRELAVGPVPPNRRSDRRIDRRIDNRIGR